MTEKIIDAVMAAMQEDLSREQLQKLENVLIMQLHGLEIRKECTRLVTSERHWEKALRLYLASKRLENCSEGTMEQYGRCIRMLMQALNKRVQEITVNDLSGGIHHLRHIPALTAEKLVSALYP